MESNKEITRLPRMVTLQEAVNETGLKYHFLRSLCLDGTLIHVTAGRRYYINADSLCEYLSQKAN